MKIANKNVSNKKTTVTVPCGNCLACLQNKRAGWSFRLYEEAKEAVSAWFVTLTYSDECLPYNSNGKMTLRKDHLQKFFKRLRLQNEENIKYYAVGEYGSIFRRPHYHIILFNADSKEDVVLAWSDLNKVETKKAGYKVYDLRGIVDFGNVERASIHYVTGYLIGPGFEYGEYYDKSVEQPFAVMSKGIGENYLYDNYAWHKVEERFYIINDKGKKQVLPRFYKEKIFNLKEKMDFAEKMEKEMFEKEINFNAYINQERQTEDAKRINKKLKLL